MKLTDDQLACARSCGIEFVPASPSQVQRLSMQRRVFQIGGEPFLATRADGFYETAGTLLRMVEDHLGDHPPALTGEGPQASPAYAAQVEDVPVPTQASAQAEATSAAAPSRQAVEIASSELAEMIDSVPVAASPNEVVYPAPVKRGRGRPRKHPRALQDGSPEAVLVESTTSTGPASEGSRRPLRSPAPNYSKAASSGPPSSAHAVSRRGPGRPRKNPASPGVIIVADDHFLIAETAIAGELPPSMATVAVRADDVRRALRIRGLKIPRWQIAGKLRRGRLK